MFAPFGLEFTAQLYGSENDDDKLRRCWVTNTRNQGHLVSPMQHQSRETREANEVLKAWLFGSDKIVSDGTLGDMHYFASAAEDRSLHIVGVPA